VDSHCKDDVDKDKHLAVDVVGVWANSFCRCNKKKKKKKNNYSMATNLNNRQKEMVWLVWFGYCFTPTDTEAYYRRLVTLY
jgi:hypothetical protein